MKTAAGKTATLKPFQVCRGYTRLAPPVTPGYQDFHWLMSVHPLDIFRPQITPDEALWMVLWTQGLSEEGGEAVLEEVDPTAPVAPVKIAEEDLTETQRSIRAAILAADNSYRVYFFAPVRSKIGMSISFMPGARIFRTVARKLRVWR